MDRGGRGEGEEEMGNERREEKREGVTGEGNAGRQKRDKRKEKRKVRQNEKEKSEKRGRGEDKTERECTHCQSTVQNFYRAEGGKDKERLKRRGKRRTEKSLSVQETGKKVNPLFYENLLNTHTHTHKSL